MTGKPKRPRDANQLAKFVADIATGARREEKMKGDARRSERKENVRRWVREYGEPHNHRIAGRARDEPDNENVGRIIYAETFGRVLNKFKADNYA